MPTKRRSKTHEADLFALRARLAELGGQVEDQLAKALEAFRERNAALGRDVAVMDRDTDARVAEIEAAALRTLAFRQPMAQDLRETVSSLRVATTLERIGDLSKSIGRRVEASTAMAPPRIERTVLHMGDLALSQVASALNAFGAMNVAAAVDLWRKDVEIDELFNSLFRDLLTHMTQDPRLVETGAELMFTAKNLERIGDHATFIAEMTYYVAIGQPLDAARPKGDPYEATSHFDQSQKV